MRHFASDTLTGKDIDFSFHAPEVGRELVLGADVRREVLLIFKEAINNVVQHAQCRHVDIGIRIVAPPSFCRSPTTATDWPRRATRRTATDS